MKKVWKWIIGIVVVLVVVAALVGGAFLMRSHFANVVALGSVTRLGGQVPNGRLPFGNQDNRQGVGPRGMMPFGNGVWGGPGMRMRGFGMMGFGMHNLFGGLVACLFGLGLLALLVLGIIWLVRRTAKPAPVAATMAAPVAVVEPAAPVAVATHACAKCGEPVQEGWKHCPNCGKRQ